MSNADKPMSAEELSDWALEQTNRSAWRWDVKRDKTLEAIADLLTRQAAVLDELRRVVSKGIKWAKDGEGIPVDSYDLWLEARRVLRGATIGEKQS